MQRSLAEKHVEYTNFSCVSCVYMKHISGPTQNVAVFKWGLQVQQHVAKHAILGVINILDMCR